MMAVIVYLVLCLIWGSTWLAIKFGLHDLPPFTAAAARFLVAVIVLGGIILVRGSGFGKSWKDRWVISFPGLFMYGLSYGCVYMAEQRIDSSLTAILFGSFPFFVILCARIYGEGSSLTLRNWIGLIIGFIGLVVITADSIGQSRELLLGSILAIAASFMAAFGLVIHQRSSVSASHETTAFLQMLLGLIPVLLIALVLESGVSINWTPTAIGSVLYLSIFGTVIAFLGYYWLMRRVSTLIVSTIAFVTPFVATIIGITAGDESLTLMNLIGGALILIGVAMVVLKEKRPLGLPTE